jgi:hypothetical protein
LFWPTWVNSECYYNSLLTLTPITVQTEHWFRNEHYDLKMSSKRNRMNFSPEIPPRTPIAKQIINATGNPDQKNLLESKKSKRNIKDAKRKDMKNPTKKSFQVQ